MACLPSFSQPLSCPETFTMLKKFLTALALNKCLEIRSGKWRWLGQPSEKQTLPFRIRLLCGTLRWHEIEIELAAPEEKPLKKRQHQLGGPGDS